MTHVFLSLGIAFFNGDVWYTCVVASLVAEVTIYALFELLRKSFSVVAMCVHCSAQIFELAQL